MGRKESEEGIVFFTGIGKKDIAQATSLINRCFGVKKKPEEIAWILSGNPLAKKMPTVLTAARKGKHALAGILCQLPVQFTAMGKTMDALCGSYMCVEKEMRGKMVSNRMGKENGRKIASIYRRLPLVFGSSTMRRIRFDFIENNLSIRMKKIFKPLNLMAALGSASVKIFQGSAKKAAGQKIREFNDVEGMVKAVQKLPSPKGFEGIAVKTGRRFLEWRFSKKNGCRYLFFALDDNGKFAAYAVLKGEGARLLLQQFGAFSCENLSSLLALLECEARSRGYLFIEFEGLPSYFFENAFRDNGYSFRKANEFFDMFAGDAAKKSFPEKFFGQEKNWLLSGAAFPYK